MSAILPNCCCLLFITVLSDPPWYKHQKYKKLTLNSPLQTHQILTNDDQMIIFCLSYLITTVNLKFNSASLLQSIKELLVKDSHPLLYAYTHS